VDDDIELSSGLVYSFTDLSVPLGSTQVFRTINCGGVLAVIAITPALSCEVIDIDRKEVHTIISHMYARNQRFKHYFGQESTVI